MPGKPVGARQAGWFGLLSSVNSWACGSFVSAVLQLIVAFRKQSATRAARVLAVPRRAHPGRRL